ncbi:alpha/beta hydrolase [Streptomyces sp. NBC_01351]|uniref:alpha/beta hydrolase n=1 Tax=Streptomyces sp. NBC_01351 TaxID=2903833 RepID=UPI002E34A0C0|nr:alpha/beta hydrolase [Streptomyces sp. NBC_01351]
MTTSSPSLSPTPARTRFEGDADRVAVIVPGVGYSPAHPLLDYARLVLLQHGWTVQQLWWRIPGEFRGFTAAERSEWVEAQVAAAVDAEGGSCRLLVGKSLGSLAAGFAADRNLPAAWLTPLLTSPRVADALTRTKAPTLLVGGTADALWDARVAGELPHRVVEIPSADHALLIPGDAVRSAGVLQRVTAELDTFVRAVG